MKSSTMVMVTTIAITITLLNYQCPTLRAQGACCDAQQSSFERLYGDDLMDFAFGLDATSNDEIIMTGTAMLTQGSFANKISMVKVDQFGTIVWTKFYDDGSGNAVRVTSDGGLILTGSGVDAGGQGGLVLMKTTGAGSVEWLRFFGGSGGADGYDVLEASDGSFIAVGRTSVFGSGNSDCLVLKVDANGNLLWQNAYGGSGTDEAYSVQEAANGDLVIAGTSQSFGAGQEDVYVLRINSAGLLQWSRAFGGTAPDEGRAVVVASDGNIFVGGKTSSFGAGQQDAYLLKLNASGTLQWSKTYGESLIDGIEALKQGCDGTLIASGEFNTASARRLLLLNLDLSGTLNFARGFEGLFPGGAIAYDVIQLSTGGYAATGSALNTSDMISFDDEFYLIRTDCEGRTGCHATIEPIVNEPSSTSTSPATITVASAAVASHEPLYCQLVLNETEVCRPGPCCDPDALKFVTKFDGGYVDDDGLALQQTGDGGYILTGLSVQTNSFTQQDLLLLKTDGDGNKQWMKLFGDDAADFGAGVRELTGGDFILAGRIDNGGGTADDAWLLRVSAGGALSWSTSFGGSDFDEALSVEPTSDGGFILAGRTASFGAGADDMYIIKTNGSGTLQWARAVGGSNTDGAVQVLETADGGFAALGSTRSFGAGGSDVYLVKLDNSGTLQWSKTFGGSADDEGLGFDETQDGGFVVAGSTRSYGAGGADVYLIRTDNTGSLQWSRAIGGSADDIANAVREACDGDYVLAGSTMSFGDQSKGDALLLKVDTQGLLLWTREYGGSDAESARDLWQAHDGGYAVLGQTSATDLTANNVYLIKTDCDGLSDCEDATISPDVASPLSSEASPMSTVANVNQQNATDEEESCVPGLEDPVCAGGVCCDPEQPVFTHTLGTAIHDRANALQETVDGGYILAGWSEGFGAIAPTNRDALLVKNDSEGNCQWSATYADDVESEFNDVQQTADFGYIAVGSIADANNSTDVFLVKTDQNGQVQWSKTFGGISRDDGHAVVQTCDGGYALTGLTFSFGMGNADIYLIRVDNAGNLLWSSVWGGSFPTTAYDAGYDLIETADGGLALVGETVGSVSGTQDVAIMRFNPAGAMMWMWAWGGGGIDAGYSIIETSDGGFAIAGYTTSFGAGARDCYILKLDNTGSLVWSRSVGGTRFDQANAIRETCEGEFVIAGTTALTLLDFDIYLAKFSATGTLLTSRALGAAGTVMNFGLDLAATRQGGFAVAGYFNDPSPPLADQIYFAKTDCDLLGACENDPITRTVTTPATQADAATLVPFDEHNCSPYPLEENCVLLVCEDQCENCCDGPTPAFVRSYDAGSLDMGTDIKTTSDGGYIMCGNTLENSIGVAWLVRTNSDGDLIWSRSYRDLGESAAAVQQADDGGFVIGGNAFSRFGDILLLKTDAFGLLQWAKNFGGEDLETGNDLQRTKDGGYILAGQTSSFGAGGSDMFLVKTDGMGNEQWSKAYGGTGFETAFSVKQTLDGGYIAAGLTSSFGAQGGQDVFVIKVDPNGTLEWAKTYATPGTTDIADDVQLTPAGGYIVSGSTNGLGAGSSDFLLLNLDQFGNVNWAATYGGASFDVSHSITTTCEGGFVAVGESGSFGTATGPDILTINISAAGTLNWATLYGSLHNNFANAVVESRQDGFATVGMAHNPGFGVRTWDDMLLIKSDCDGNTECDITPVNPIVQFQSLSVNDVGASVASAMTENTLALQSFNPDVDVSNFCERCCEELNPQFERLYGESTDGELARGLDQTSDRGYVVTGDALGTGPGRDDVYLTRTDKTGTQQWARTYGGEAHDAGNAVQVTRNGDIIIAGETVSYGAGGFDQYLILTDHKGTAQWSRTFGGAGYEAAQDVVQTNNDGYVLVGSSTSFGPGSQSAFVNSVDANGLWQWSLAYGGNQAEDANAVIETQNGNLVLAGYSTSFGAGGKDFYVLRTNASGAIIWSSTFGGLLDETAEDVVELSDGSLLIVGSTASFGLGGTIDVFVVRTSSAGAVLWAAAYGSSVNNETAFAASEICGESIVIAGGSNSFNGGGFIDGFLLEIDFNGAIRRTRLYGNAGQDNNFEAVLLAEDGGIAAAGWQTDPSDLSTLDAYLVKTDCDLQTGCEQQVSFVRTAVPQVLSPTLTTTTAQLARQFVSAPAFTPNDREVDVCPAADNPCCAAGQTAFENRYGSSDRDKALATVETSDGGFASVGETAGFGANPDNVYLVKTDAAGTLQWSKAYGGTGDDLGNDLCEASGGDLLIAGVSNSFSSGGDDDMYVLRTSSGGALQWSVTLGGSDADRAYSIEPTSDGSFIVAGMTRSCGAGGSDAYVCKVGGDGSLLWAKSYGGSGDEEARSIIQTSDGGYLFVGYTESLPMAPRSMYIVKLDFLGVVQWTRGLSDFSNIEAMDVIETSAGDYLIVGTNELFVPPMNDIIAVMIDASGGLLWGRTYWGAEDDVAYSVSETCECTFAIAGYTATFGAGGRDACLTTIDDNGDQLSWLAYGTSDSEEAHDLFQASTGGFVLAGWTNTNAGSAEDVYLIKTLCDGTTGCEAENTELAWVDIPTPLVEPPALTLAMPLSAIVSTVETSAQAASNTVCMPAALVVSDVEEEEDRIVPGLPDSNAAFSLYPNPIQSGDALTLRFSGQAEAGVDISVSTLVGRTIYSGHHTPGRGVNEILVSTADWPAGSYIVSLATENAVMKRFVIVLN